MKIETSKIKIKPGSERFRKDHGELEELAFSIKQYGQLQPIVVNKDMELIAGGRRLAACELYKMPVEVRVIDENDQLRMREMEVEENIQRKDFTPAEYSLAVRELHQLKEEIYGAVSDNLGDKGWKQDDTAKLLGTSRSHISSALVQAELIDNFPELLKCKTKKELSNSTNALMKLLNRATSIEDITENVEKSDRVIVSNTSAEEFFSTLEDNSIDIILCDPPYGIDISKVAIGKSGKTGGSNEQGFTFGDSKQEALDIVNLIAYHSKRVCKNTAHAYIFCAPEFFKAVYNIFLNHDWQPHIRPLIWAKPGQGQSNMPERWPVVSYEMCLYARRENSKLQYAKPDVLTYNRVSPAQKIHPTQKPVELLQDLIHRSVLPGSTLLDPCMGSGSSLVAGLKEGLVVKGCDVEKAAYTAALEHINQTLGEEKDGS